MKSVFLGVVLVIVLFGAAVVNLGHSTRRLEETLLQRTLQPLRLLLEEADRSRDDLAIQKIVQAMTPMTGLEWVGFLNKEGQFVAHSDPSRIGVTWTGPMSPGDRLVADFNNDLQTRFHRRLTVWGVLCGSGVIALILSQFIFWRRRAARLQDDYQETLSLLQEREEMVRKTRMQLSDQEKILKGRLQLMATQARHPFLLLDERQRIVACHPDMAARLGAAPAVSLLGQSWQDLPALHICSTALSESLINPNRTFRVRSLSSDLTLDLWTSVVDSACTWIQVIP